MSASEELRRPSRVLACIDFSPVSEAVVHSAASWARPRRAEIVLLHVAAPEPAFLGYEAGPQSVRDAVAERLREEHRHTQAIAKTLREDGHGVLPLTVQGDVVERILDHAERLEAEVIMLGSHGRGRVLDLLVGSVTHGVLRHAKIPVLVVPATR